MDVVVTNPDYEGPECRLTSGDRLIFGRGTGGIGYLGEDPTISRRHGQIAVTANGYTIEATGTFAGVTVTDLTTPSRLHVPNGVGPIDIPFRDSRITVDADGGAATLHVHVNGSGRADAWDAQWGIDAPAITRFQPTDRGFGNLSGRRTVRSVSRYRKSNGVYYSWFTVLVALCEPALTTEDGVSPSNGQLAARTGYRKGNIERMLSQVYDALDIDPAITDRPREVAISRALSAGIVTHGHLSMLPPLKVRRRSTRTRE